MKVPPLLIAGALVCWGWLSELWWLALPMALIAELPAIIRSRWELTLRERRRVADFCTLLVAVCGAYLYLSEPHTAAALLTLARWSPALVFPLLAVQLYGDRPGVELSVLFLSLRRRPAEEDRLVDLRPFFALLCLMAAAMAPPGTTVFYPAAALLAAWALWTLRSPDRSPWLWAALLAAAIGGGHLLALGLQQAQRSVEDLAVEWLASWLGDRIDPYRAHTSIGDLGDLKLSGRIVLRVRTDHPLRTPLLLRSASYNRYVQGSWLTGPAPFIDLERRPRGWRLAPAGSPGSSVEVTLKLDEGQGILPLPARTGEIDGLTGARLSRNPYGAVKVLDGPDLARYRVDYGSGSTDAPPEPADLRIPRNESASIAQAAAELKLGDLPPTAVLSRVRSWFLKAFRYDLELAWTPPGRTPLEQFLQHRRRGHCEYFASAAVLLLRQAGIPARYAVGWSVQEYSELERSYVARARHAHAWVLAWIDGAWTSFDPTPPDWFGLDSRENALWASLRDGVAWLLFRLQDNDSDRSAYTPYLAGTALLLGGVLALRILRRRRLHSPRGQGQKQLATPGGPFAAVEELLRRQGHGRAPHETLREWLQRLKCETGEPVASLLPALDLYYRQRFDPEGLSTGEQARMHRLLHEWQRNRAAK